MTERIRGNDNPVEQEQQLSEPHHSPEETDISVDKPDKPLRESNEETGNENNDEPTTLTKRDSSGKLIYRRYKPEDKSDIFFLVHNRAMTASDAALKMGIPLTTVRRWLKEDEKQPDYAFTKEKSKGGRRPDIPKLTNEQTKILINEIDDNPSITITELFDKLTNVYKDLQISKSGINKFIKEYCYLSLNLSKKLKSNSNGNFLSDSQISKERSDWIKRWSKDINPNKNCIFVGEATFNVSLMRSLRWDKSGQRSSEKAPVLRTTTTTVLGAISANGPLHFEVKYKRAAPDSSSPYYKRRKLIDGSILNDNFLSGSTSHYLNFIQSLVEELNTDNQYNDSFILLENVPFDNQRNIADVIESNKFRCLFLPPQSSDFNAIEDFWPIVKGYIKRSRLGDNETMEERIREGADAVSLQEYSKICTETGKSMAKAV